MTVVGGAVGRAAFMVWKTDVSGSECCFLCTILPLGPSDNYANRGLGYSSKKLTRIRKSENDSNTRRMMIFSFHFVLTYNRCSIGQWFSK